ncbi:MAG: MarR family transcriptional regulator [Chloroflexota bacterium]
MKIEQEIQQKRFTDVYHKAHINVLYTSSWLNQHIHEVLKPFRISWQQYNILRILRGLSPRPASIKLLTRKMIDKTSNASRLVDKLERKGLVQRTTCPEDRRRLEVQLTEEGHALLATTSELMEVRLREQMSSLSHEEAQTLNELLDKMRT